jgi:hypothetical protein
MKYHVKEYVKFMLEMELLLPVSLDLVVIMHFEGLALKSYLQFHLPVLR